MRVFIVHAHHEPKSFNGAMTQEAVVALKDAGHEVIVSDLYAMAFNPVSDRRNFITTANREYLRQQAEEIHASEYGGFAADIGAEMEKLFWCDTLVFQFPLWWFGLPAILKGWVDRVFAMRRIYGGGRYYDRGILAGRRAMCSLTTGGGAPSYSVKGLSGAMSSILFPIHHGIFYFTGFTVVEPFVVHAPVRMTQEVLVSHLARYRERILRLQSAPAISYAKLEEYDEQSVLIARQ
jgi:NAD(P)H dehydrogenase (quinone)